MPDPYLDLVRQHWSHIVMLYEQYVDKRPVMLFDIQEQRVYAMPYDGYRAELSEPTQLSLKTQYEDAETNGKIIVFVRDNNEQKLVSYSLPQTEATPEVKPSRPRGRGKGKRQVSPE